MGARHSQGGRSGGGGGDLEVDARGIRHAPRRIQDFQRDEIAIRVIVEDHPRLVLVALGHPRVRHHHAQRVGVRIVGDMHGSAVHSRGRSLIGYYVRTLSGPTFSKMGMTPFFIDLFKIGLFCSDQSTSLHAAPFYQRCSSHLQQN